MLNENMITVPTTMLGSNYDIHLGCWTEKLNGYRVYSNGDKACLDGGLGIGLSLLHTEENNAWFNDIPSAYLTATECFPEYQYQMLWLAANNRNAEQLLSSRPLLLAFICHKFPVDNDAALTMAERGQREILAKLGLDDSKSALKFIDKLELTYERANEFPHVLKQLDRDFSRFKVFKHYDKVTYRALVLDHSHPFLTGTRLGKAIANGERCGSKNLVNYLADTLTLGQVIGVQDPVRNIEHLANVEQLIALHDEWADQQMDLRFERQKPKNTDVPYVKRLNDGFGITQVVDYDDLCKEAKDQRHCVVIYHNRVSAGHYAVYRMYEPERMTIGISINMKKAFPFDIEQISGYKNALPSNETRQIIYDWFEACRVGNKLF